MNRDTNTRIANANAEKIVIDGDTDAILEFSGRRPVNKGDE